MTLHLKLNGHFIYTAPCEDDLACSHGTFLGPRTILIQIINLEDLFGRFETSRTKLSPKRTSGTILVIQKKKDNDFTSFTCRIFNIDQLANNACATTKIKKKDNNSTSFTCSIFNSDGLANNVGATTKTNKIDNNSTSFTCSALVHSI